MQYWKHSMKADAAMTDNPISLSARSRFRTAMILAIIADALQIIIFPAFAEGALSPADDVLDFVVAAILVPLLGWHWEFLPSFLAKLVPGVDLVPFWTLAVANVYRKWKQVSRETIDAYPSTRSPEAGSRDADPRRIDSCSSHRDTETP